MASKVQAETLLHPAGDTDVLQCFGLYSRIKTVGEKIGWFESAIPFQPSGKFGG